MKPCPNCEQPVEPGTNFCPHCGADTRPLWTQPDVSSLLEADMPDFTARRRSDQRAQILGFLTGLLVGTCTFPLGFLILLLLWASSQHSNPYFAKGITKGGWTVVVLFGLLVLGALIVCSRNGH